MSDTLSNRTLDVEAHQQVLVAIGIDGNLGGYFAVAPHPAPRGLTVALYGGTDEGNHL